MKNEIVILKKKTDLILKEVSKETPLIIFRQFLKSQVCKKIVKLCIDNCSLENHRKKKFNKVLDFYSIDVLPKNVKTNRIFRTFELSGYTVNKFKELKKIIDLQKKIIKLTPKKKIYKKFQVIHYPKGGGHFDWHHHPRYPTNYGFIITLSKKGKNFNQGVTNFKVRKKILNLEKFNISIGDLILFRYDLPHSISKVDSKEDLRFDSNGRWTLVLPVYHGKF